MQLLYDVTRAILISAQSFTTFIWRMRSNNSAVRCVIQCIVKVEYDSFSRFRFSELVTSSASVQLPADNYLDSGVQ